MRLSLAIQMFGARAQAGGPLAFGFGGEDFALLGVFSCA
jgi:hypothetical protein